MTLSSIFSLFLLVLGCVGSDDPKPNKDAPDLDLSKAQWVNPYQYDGVFTIRKYSSMYAEAHYIFNGAGVKSFTPINKADAIENGFWFDEVISKYVGPDASNYTPIDADVRVNGAEFDRYIGKHYLQLGKLDSENGNIKYNSAEGITWEVKQMAFPKNDTFKEEYKLSKEDEPSFLFKTERLNVFPDAIKIEKEYKFSGDEKEIKIQFDSSKDADMIYITFGINRYKFGSFVPSGYLKYLKNDATSFTISKNDLLYFVRDASKVTMTVSAVKFYTTQKGNRKFLFQNVGQSSATIILE